MSDIFWGMVVTVGWEDSVGQGNPDINKHILINYICVLTVLKVLLYLNLKLSTPPS